MTQGAPPSGRQVEIVHGAQRAIVVEVGGGLRRYDVDGVPVLDGYATQEIWGGSRGQLLAPWPNRLGDGLLVLDPGATHGAAEESATSASWPLPT